MSFESVSSGVSTVLLVPFLASFPALMVMVVMAMMVMMVMMVMVVMVLMVLMVMMMLIVGGSSWQAFGPRSIPAFAEIVYSGICRTSLPIGFPIGVSIQISRESNADFNADFKNEIAIRGIQYGFP